MKQFATAVVQAASTRPAYRAGPRRLSEPKIAFRVLQLELLPHASLVPSAFLRPMLHGILRNAEQRAFDRPEARRDPLLTDSRECGLFPEPSRTRQSGGGANGRGCQQSPWRVLATCSSQQLPEETGENGLRASMFRNSLMPPKKTRNHFPKASKFTGQSPAEE